MSYKDRTFSEIYYLAFAVYIFFSACSHSMIAGLPLMGKVIPLCRYACLLVMVFKLYLVSKVTINRLLSWTFGIVLAAVVFLFMDSFLPFTLVVAVFSAYQCSPNRLARICLWMTGSVVLLSAVLSKIGIIKDVVQIRSSNGYARHSLGMQYTTVLATFCFFLICLFLYTRKKITAFHYIGILLLDYILFVLTNARMEAAMILLLMICVFLFNKLRINRGIIGWILTYSVPFSCIAAFALEFLYMLNPVDLEFLNRIFSKRLSITEGVILEHGFHLFGKNFFMQGFGTPNFDWSLGYNYVDSFYINYTLKYGVLFMIVFCLLYTVICRTLARNQKSWLLLFLCFGAVHGILISSIILPQCNPFFVIAYAEYSNIVPALKKKRQQGYNLLSSS